MNPGDQVLTSGPGLPRPGPGEFVGARLVPKTRRDGVADGGGYARSIRLADADWRLAAPADPAGPAPVLPR